MIYLNYLIISNLDEQNMLCVCGIIVWGMDISIIVENCDINYMLLIVHHKNGGWGRILTFES
ncbi:uncharacterized protein METZ01_LOCUS501683 [marine metagenome]|uniref:Uncharacterized protein n=1 Tax=marine metagenome TaxID=408172 RepID=A0A383DWX9_9ZZZZ